MKKIISVILAMMMIITAVPMLVACEPDLGYDPTKTQIFVANYDGGVGTNWLYDLKPRFEAATAGISYEEGKSGAELVIDPSKGYQGTQSLLAMATSYQNVYFSEAVYVKDLINSDILYDLSDIVKEGDNSIESRMLSDEKNAIKAYGNGKYYALPHYEMYNGIIYDIDLFEDRLFYFSADPQPGSKGFVIDKNEQRSLGPDKKTGVIDGIDYSLDDGLPSTIDEFFALMDYMAVDNGVIPFLWTEGYFNMLCEKIMLNMDGAKASRVFFDFNEGLEEGVTPVKNNIITSFSGTTPNIEQITITEENGYLLEQSASKYEALKFAQRLYADSKYYSSSVTSGTNTNEIAHEKYIYSSIDPAETPIAMLIEGTYWYQESSDVLARSVREYPATPKDRNFGYMPLPLGEGIDRQPLNNSYYSYCVVNGNIKGNESKERVVADFLKFVYSDEELRKFTMNTGTARQFDYDLSDTEIKSMPKYYQNVWEMRKNGEVVNSCSSNPLFFNNISSLSQSYYEAWKSTVLDQTFTNVTTAFGGGVKPQTYFESFKVTQQQWNSKYGAYFND